MIAKLVFSLDTLQPIVGWHIDREQKIQNELLETTKDQDYREPWMVAENFNKSPSINSLVLISNIKQTTSDPATVECIEQVERKGPTVKSLVPASNSELSTFDPATVECIEQVERKGPPIESLVLISNIEQTPSDPATAECIEQVERPTVESLVLVSNSEQTASDPAAAECIEEVEKKGPTVESLVLVSNTEQTASDPATSESIEQVEEKGSSIKPLALIADIDQTTSDPATAECIEQVKRKGEISEQTTSDPATAEYIQQYKKKRKKTALLYTHDHQQLKSNPWTEECGKRNRWNGQSELSKLVSGNFFVPQNSNSNDLKSVFWATLVLSLLASSHGFSQGNHVSCAVNSNANLTDWKLMCHFQEDVNKSRRNFQAFRMRHEDTPELILDVMWNGNSPFVYTAPGYYHDGLISDRVVVRIQMNIIHYGAMYICILPSETLEKMRTCEISRTAGRLITTTEHFTQNTGFKPVADQNLLPLLLLLAAVLI